MIGMRARLLAVTLLMAVLLSLGAVARDRFSGDLALARAIQDVRAAPLEETMEFVSIVGRGLPMVAGALAIFCWLVWKRQKAEYLAVGGALLSLGLNPVLKLLVERPRPTEDLVMVWRDQSGLSFPSGHAFTAILLFGLLYYLVPTFLRWQRAITLVRILSLTMILLIGISRVYLGAHWPSDVLGGFLFGGIMLALVIHLHQQHAPQGDLNQAGL